MIEKTKDPLILELKAIAETKLTIPCTFIRANLFEANYGLDQLEEAQFPVLIHVFNARAKNTINEANQIIRTVPMSLMLLTSRKEATSDFDSYEVNNDIHRMYKLAENLVYWINQSPMSVNGGVEEFNSEEIYAKGDTHLFGQGITLTWKANTGVSGYHKIPVA